MTMDTSGNFGIGTSSPTYKLHVYGTSGVLRPTAEGTTNQVDFHIKNSGGDFYFGMDDSAGTISGTAYASYIYSSAAKPIVFFTTTTERMRIDSSGNVGIGTSSPSAKLHTYTAGSSLQAIFEGTTLSPYVQVKGNSGSTLLGNESNGGWVGTVGAQAFVFKTTDTERMRIDSSGYVTNAVNGNNAGLHQAQLYYRLNSGVVGSNATGAQSLFGVGVTLVGSTVYEFEMSFSLFKSAGTTAHTISLLFGGTATINNIGYSVLAGGIAGAAGTTSAATNNTFGVAATATVVTASFTTTGPVDMIVKGTVSVNAGGTFIPQYSLSAAPGGAYTTQIGSYVKISPLSASGANTNIGGWA